MVTDIKIDAPLDTKKNWMGIAIVFAFLLGINPIIHHQRSQLGLDKSAFYDTPKKILGSTFREIRVTLADILWIKVDTYFHSALTPEEHEMIHPGHPEHMKGIVHNTGSAESVNSQFLPLVVLVTDLDPNFIDAYSSGAWWLWKRLNKTDQAIDFLKDGIKNNPENFELHYDLAWVYFLKKEDYTSAKLELLQALQKKMDDRDQSSALELLGSCYQRLNENTEAAQTWEKIVKINMFPYCDAAKRRLAELKQTQITPTESKHVHKSS